MVNQIHLLKISRLEALTDGVFAIAMTILVLDLHLPYKVVPHDLFFVIKSTVFIKLLIYIGSFVILGTLWVAMNFQLGLVAKLNRQYMWANIFYLMMICVVPFSSSLLASYPEDPVSIYFYALNLLFACFGQLLTFTCAHYFQLNHRYESNELKQAIFRRIFVAPVFYFMSMVVAQHSVAFAFFLLVAPTLIYIFPGKVDKYEEINTA